MKTKFKIIRSLVILAYIISIAGCEDSISSPPLFTVHGLHGKIINEKGEKVTGASVHFIYSFTPLPAPSLQNKDKHRGNDTSLLNADSVYLLEQNYPNPFEKNTSFQYALPFKSNVRLTLIDETKEIIAETILDEVQQPGNYMYFYSAGKSVGNGLFRLNMSAKNLEDSTVFIKELFVFRNEVDDDVLVNLKSFTISDSSGNFFVDYPSVPIGRTIVSTNGKGPNIIENKMVAPNVEIVLIKDGYKILHKKAVIDKSKLVELEFILKK